jgi:hypothetical protein
MPPGAGRLARPSSPLENDGETPQDFESVKADLAWDGAGTPVDASKSCAGSDGAEGAAILMPRPEEVHPGARGLTRVCNPKGRTKRSGKAMLL